MRLPRRLRPLLAALCLASLVWAPLLASQDLSPAQLTFIKVFKGSRPEYTRLTVAENGEATYEGRSLDETQDPESFWVSAEMTARLFALAAKLNYFRDTELESGQKVAHLGKKTFIYTKGGQRSEVSYNYTRSATAKELQELCEGIARGRFWIRQIEFRLYFDRLGMPEVMQGFEHDFNAGLLADPQQFVPLLKRIVGDQRLMRLARSRAEALLRRIRSTSGRLQFEHGDQQTGWYYRVSLDEGGSATYVSRRFDQADKPELLRVPTAAAARLFELARQAHYFRDLQNYQELSGRLSGYRLTYEAGSEHNEVAFSAPPTAAVAEIIHIFRKLLQQERYLSRLQAALKEESVMLQVILQELATAVSRDQLLEPKEFVPLLEQIAQGSNQHAQTRQQAQRLLVRIQAAN